MLVGPDGATYRPASSSVGSFTGVTATFPANIPAGTYSVRVTSGSLSDASPFGTLLGSITFEQETRRRRPKLGRALIS